MTTNFDGRLLYQKKNPADYSSSVFAETDGLSAYQIALSNGFVGTEEEWLASLANATSFFNYNQVSASVSWIINHDLGFYPNISTFDESGDELRGQIIHHSALQAEVQFNSPRAGNARAS